MRKSELLPLHCIAVSGLDNLIISVFKMQNCATELLKDESSDVDFVGPTLPSLKSLLAVSSKNSGPTEMSSQLVHGLLSACMLHIDEMK